jgi:Beta-lactamase
LNATSYGLPTDSKTAIIPVDPITSGYTDQMYDRSPAGGYYSSISDMTKLGRSILNSTLLIPSQTRGWLKPKSFTSSPNSSVGAPWEIYRAPSDRVSYLYTKNGATGTYASNFVLMPDYNTGFTVFAVGAEAPNAQKSESVLSDIIASVFYPAFEAAAKEEATANYAGVYTDTTTGLNSSITVVTDDRPGLGITEWVYNGSTFQQIFSRIIAAPITIPFGIRLYPTGLKTVRDGKVTRTAWRAVFDIPAPVDPGPFSTNCLSWTGVDLYTYGGIGADQFVFNLASDGKAVSIDPRALQQAPLRLKEGMKSMARRNMPFWG